MFSAKHNTSFPALKASHSSWPFFHTILKRYACLMHPKSLIHRNLVAFAKRLNTDFDKVAEVSAPLFKAGTAKCPIIIESTSLSIPFIKGYNHFQVIVLIRFFR
jgi:hypothetical protein